jgi:hypothetical protein
MAIRNPALRIRARITAATMIYVTSFMPNLSDSAGSL